MALISVSYGCLNLHDGWLICFVVCVKGHHHRDQGLNVPGRAGFVGEGDKALFQR